MALWRWNIVVSYEDLKSGRPTGDVALPPPILSSKP